MNEEREYFIQYKGNNEYFAKKMQSNFLKNIINEAHIDAILLYRFTDESLTKNDKQPTKRCEILNKILSHCIIPPACRIGQGTRLGYESLGILIHADTQIGKYCPIGTNVTRK